MYGDSIKCDVCENTEFVKYKTEDRSEEGWIKMHVNRPKLWNFVHIVSQSTLQISVDCCSIECARSVLREASDATSQLETAS